MDSSGVKQERNRSNSPPSVHGVNLSAYAHVETCEKDVGKEPLEPEVHVHGVNLSAYSHLDPEKVLTKMGKYGTYQMVIYAMTNFAFFLYACETMVMSLIAVDPSFECVVDESKSSIPYEVVDQCYVQEIGSNKSLECGRVPNTYFLFNGSKHASLASEFDLVCDEKYWSQHGMSFFMIGNMLSTPIITQIADRYGRRFSFLIPLWIAVFSNIGCSLAPTYGIFLVFRFLAGVGTSGLSTIGYVIMLESVAPKFRALTSIVLNIVWVAGYMTVGVVHIYFKDNWRYLYFVISAPGLLAIGFYWIMPESLHWMITHKKTVEISKFIERSSRWNRVELSLHECRASVSEEYADELKKKASRRTFLDIFKSRPFMFHLFLHCYIMIVMNFTYWALSLFSVDLHENEMVGYFLSGLVELPALVGIILLHYFGRRTVTFMALLAQGFSMIGAVLAPPKTNMSMTMSLLGKVFNNIAWTSAPLLQGEMAPTSMRNMFYGLIGFVGEIGSISAPYLNILKEYHESAPFVVIAAMSFLAALFSLCSPETKDKPMPEDLDQFNPGFMYNYLFRHGKAKKKAPVKVSIKDTEAGKQNVPMIVIDDKELIPIAPVN